MPAYVLPLQKWREHFVYFNTYQAFCVPNAYYVEVKVSNVHVLDASLRGRPCGCRRAWGVGRVCGAAGACVNALGCEFGCRWARIVCGVNAWLEALMGEWLGRLVGWIRGAGRGEEEEVVVAMVMWWRVVARGGAWWCVVVRGGA